jgi:cytochrome c
MRMNAWIVSGVLVVAMTGAATAQEPTDTAFKKWCTACHAIGEGAGVKLGPPLNGIDGRTAGSVAGFNYSPASKASGIVWNEAVFKEYIKNPMQKMPGTRMAFAGVRNEQEVNDIWAYVSQFDQDGNKKTP